MPDLMPKAVVDRLRAFAQSGGKVLFLGRTPPLIVDRADRDARTARPGEFDWAMVSAKGLDTVPTPSQFPPAAPPPPQSLSPALRAAVAKAVSGEDLTVATPTTALRAGRTRLASPQANVARTAHSGRSMASNSSPAADRAASNASVSRAP
jgi:hypothetical protein